MGKGPLLHHPASGPMGGGFRDKALGFTKSSYYSALMLGPFLALHHLILTILKTRQYLKVPFYRQDN